MKTVSLKIDNSIYDDLDSVLGNLKISRNRYINDAIKFYNDFQKRQILVNELEKESKLVSSESMKVLGEFSELDNAY
jgi:metal-responsive CopG/Arc/MetJ family transcriptional regulator